MIEKNIQPIFQSIFGPRWIELPTVMHKHYAVCSGSEDVVTVKGALDVQANLVVKLIGRLLGMLVPASGKNVPVTVHFFSGKEEPAFLFDRVFHYASSIRK